MARGQDQSTLSAGAEAEGRSVGTRSWLILSECHWLTIIGELRSLWFIIILIIALTQLFFELHLFIYLDIFLVKWRLEETKISRKSSWIYFAIQIDKNQVDPTFDCGTNQITFELDAIFGKMPKNVEVWERWDILETQQASGGPTWQPEGALRGQWILL